MGSNLLNVRLDAERVRKVRKLKATGVALSDMVREAIDARFDALEPPLTPSAVKAAVARILRDSPDPTDLPDRVHDVHDARAARTAVRTAMGRRRR